LTAVIAGLTTVWIAFSKADTVISDDSSHGIGITQANEMDKRAHFLALSADIKVMNSGMLNIDLHGKLASNPQRLLINLVRPLAPDSSSRPANLILAYQSGQVGAYSAVLPPISAGERKLVLEPEDRKWRLTGLWEAPFSGTLHLAAKSISDSTMLP
jgi:hypothetical protein